MGVIFEVLLKFPLQKTHQETGTEINVKVCLSNR